MNRWDLPLDDFTFHLNGKPAVELYMAFFKHCYIGVDIFMYDWGMKTIVNVHV